MTRRRIFSVAAIGALAGGLATSASAQFTPLFNNLKCYKIGGTSPPVSLTEPSGGKATCSGAHSMLLPWRACAWTRTRRVATHPG